MTNKRASGAAFQRWIKDFLIEKGWDVHNQTSSVKMVFIKGKKTYVSHRNDILGAIDLLCKKADRETLWIQATLDSGLGRKTEKIKAVQFDDLYDDVQVWMKRADKGVDVFLWSSIEEKTILLGKIIRRKFYASEGIDYQF